MIVTLIERRPTIRRLPQAVVVELVERYPEVVEVRPTLRRDRYALTPRGYAGILRLSDCTLEIRPKLPWHRVRCLFGQDSLKVSRQPYSQTVVTGDCSALLLDLFAQRLAELMLSRAAAGLYREYVEREAVEPHVRGRLNLTEHLRNGWRRPGLFDQLVEDLSPDVPANRVPRAAANLLSGTPGLSPESRNALVRAVAAFDGVSEAATPTDRTAPWPDGYRELLDWCHLLASGQLLISLEQAFERFATRLFEEALGQAVESKHAIRWQGDHLSLRLIPDVVVRSGEAPVTVWDAKWKKPVPAEADVRQVLAYAASLGVKTAGLVYPGPKFRVRTLRPSTGVDLTLYLVRLPLTDDPSVLRRARYRLRRLLRRWS